MGSAGFCVWRPWISLQRPRSVVLMDEHGVLSRIAACRLKRVRSSSCSSRCKVGQALEALRDAEVVTPVAVEAPRALELHPSPIPVLQLEKDESQSVVTVT